MTKTESLRAAIKTMAIETCQEWLQCEMSEGVRAAIPNTKNLIMVGPADWIAKHLPGVEAIADLSQFGSIRDYADFREDLERLSEPGLAKAQAKIIRKEIYDTIDARVANAIKAYRLAATTQASAAQAEPVAWMVGRELFLSHDAIPPRLLPPLGNPMPLYAATSSTDAQAAAEVRILSAALEDCATHPRKAQRQNIVRNARRKIAALRAGDTGSAA